jgi:small subunit ribosomal protein S6
LSNNVYECLFLLDSNRYARDTQAVSAGLNEMVDKLDGEVLATRLWNEQRLAYPIRGHRKGTYWITYFKMEGGRLGEFERACKLNTNVLRSLTLAVDSRLVDVLVAHVLGEATTEEVEEAQQAVAAEEASTDTPAEEAPAEEAPAEEAPAEEAPAEEAPAEEAPAEEAPAEEAPAEEAPAEEAPAEEAPAEEAPAEEAPAEEDSKASE